jgi:hypothetical protein
MCRWNGFSTPLAIVIAIIVMTAAQVDAVSVTMSPYGDVGQTRIFRGDLSGLGVGTVYSAMVTDAGTGGGQTGVFSGFDLDFLVLDADGNLATTGDQVLPLTALTSVTPGSIRDQASSPYQPTLSHPGSLFGCNTDGSIDFATASITACNAFYNELWMAVDTSGGFTTLGDDGSLTAKFPDTAIGSSLWLFVGETGILSLGSTEGLRANVEINSLPSVPAPGAILLASLGGILIGGLRRRKIL